MQSELTDGWLDIHTTAQGLSGPTPLCKRDFTMPKSNSFCHYSWRTLITLNVTKANGMEKFLDLKICQNFQKPYHLGHSKYEINCGKLKQWSETLDSFLKVMPREAWSPGRGPTCSSPRILMSKPKTKVNSPATCPPAGFPISVDGPSFLLNCCYSLDVFVSPTHPRKFICLNRITNEIAGGGRALGR